MRPNMETICLKVAQRPCHSELRYEAEMRLLVLYNVRSCKEACLRLLWRSKLTSHSCRTSMRRTKRSRLHTLDSR
ncbi:hypothetical protein BTJ68_02800 [Hortaea werneckii EXF-2000]|uniref:Uncharacterized protein n=1 Tax=Hortaea werneckii EXF-2000 TaxID=1157616 RepID=A0A1Z5TNT1_HORWE|nr:hypothetical protein BTJ68_02800 [Hortaea werneckii EXF-2000]